MLKVDNAGDTVAGILRKILEIIFKYSEVKIGPKIICICFLADFDDI
jgi:hypothetical protein